MISGFIVGRRSEITAILLSLAMGIPAPPDALMPVAL
jgi:hypothetical protein